MTELEKAIQYVRENKDWTDAEEQVAMDDIGKMRCSLSMTRTGEKICDHINDLLEEYGEDNGLPEGWWMSEVDDVEEIFWEL